MTRVVVVIPCYKAKLSEDDRVSLGSFTRHLSGYDRVAMVPRGLDVGALREADRALAFEPFDPAHFVSWKSYNAFCKMQAIYEPFRSFDYMLIAQLDAYVFRDELQSWCERGFDSVGTPWPGNRSTLWHWLISYVGGGGFSLRRPTGFIAACQRLRWVPGARRMNEDALFASRPVRLLCPGLRRQPSLSEALEFGFDAEPERCFKMGGCRLPFGCHGWTWANRREFWRRFIPQ